MAHRLFIVLESKTPIVKVRTLTGSNVANGMTVMRVTAEYSVCPLDKGQPWNAHHYSETVTRLERIFEWRCNLNLNQAMVIWQYYHSPRTSTLIDFIEQRLKITIWLYFSNSLVRYNSTLRAWYFFFDILTFAQTFARLRIWLYFEKSNVIPHFQKPKSRRLVENLL